jgi:hypothetical protein
MPETSRLLFAFDWSGKAVGKNDKFLGRSSKVLSPQYRGFVAEIAAACFAATKTRDCRENLYVEINMKSSLRDAHNIEEPLFDGIEASGVIKNDSQVKRHYLVSDPKKRGAPDEIHVIVLGRWRNR